MTSCKRSRPDTDDTLSIASDTSLKKNRMELPGIIEKKRKEDPIPHPFPFPLNFRPEVQICLKSGKMSAEARRHFLSSIASAMFAYRR